MTEVLSNDPAIDVTIGAHQSMGLKVMPFVFLGLRETHCPTAVLCKWVSLMQGTS